MVTKYLSFLLMVMTASLLALAACSPAGQGGSVTLYNDGSTQVVPAGAGIGSGQGSAGAGASAEGGVTEPGLPQWGPPVIFTDSTYKFSLTHPSDFVLGNLPADKLALLTPKPVISFLFTNPITAASTVPDEPADLQINIFSLGGAAALDGWLSSTALAGPGFTSASFKTDNVSGVKVCSTTMIFPSCRYYVLGKEWVYQLTSVTIDGDNMLNSFVLSP